MDIQAILMVLCYLVTRMQYVELATPDSCSWNQFKHGELCCALCKPGTAVSSNCNNTNQTVCASCEEGTYSTEWTSKKDCSACGNKNCQPTMELVQTCNATADNKCGCVGPDKFHHIATDSCRYCTRCPAGRYPIKPCTSETICAPCPENTFSNMTNMEECKKCTECQLHFTKCNGTHDAVCLIDVLTTTQRKSVDYDTSTAASPTPTTQTTEKFVRGTIDSRSDKKIGPAIIIGVIVCVCLITVISSIVALVCWKKRKEPYSTVPGSNVIQESRRKSFSFGGLLLRDLSGDIILYLHAMLNPATLNDWKALAAKLDITHLQIINFEREIDAAAREMLYYWSTSDEATVDKLYKALQDIGRDDVCTFLEENIKLENQETIV